VKFKEYKLPAIIGVSIVLSLSSLFFINLKPVVTILSSLGNWTYDLQVRNGFTPLPKNCPITIIDIDDKSISAIGRWPWPRNYLAKLVDNAHKIGSNLLVFDITFPDPERNIVDEVLSDLPDPNQDCSAIQLLESVKEQFNYDEQFANSLKTQPSILGIVFANVKNPQGVLPSPLMTLSPELANQLGIVEMPSYLANIDLLQKEAISGGFVNATPDFDGVIRSSPLLLRYKDSIYPSLALEAARIYLKAKKTELVIRDYAGTAVLEGIKLDNTIIHTGPWGRILVPFRGPPYTFNYVSAIDLINGTAPQELIENKILFIGSTATAIGDLRSTAIAPVFSGIEIQASIASGILDHYIPHRPAWGKGVTLFQILAIGIPCAIIFPYLGPIVMFIVTTLLCTAILFANWWIWLKSSIVLYVFFPISITVILLLFNLVYGFLIQAKQRKEIKSIFGQYVAPEYVEIMLDKEEGLSLEGESKELTVLFSDIFNFTTMSEKMGAPQLKKILNQYFTPMTEAIFSHHGTIDKYVGDLVMAFWGAPVENPKHAYDAVGAALDMQKKLGEINAEFKNTQSPEIKIGIGINTGMMNVGDMGSKFRRAYTVLGDPVNLASRLEKLTRVYQIGIIVGEATWKLTKDEFIYRKLGKVKVKGKDAVTEIYQPICISAESTPQLTQQIQIYDQAYDHYSKRDWDSAEKLFKELQNSDPGSSLLYETFLKRIEEFRSTAPPQNWDGTFSLEA